MKKQNIFKSVLSLSLVALIGMGGVLLTNSKYTATEYGQGSTSIAKWKFDISGTDTYSQSDTIENITLAQTCDEKTLIDKQIAPGTSGSFDIIIDSTDAEVGIDYEVTFSNIPTNFPKNLKFFVDDKEYQLEEGFTGTIDANDTEKVLVKTVNWSWEYETENGDNDDTQDGLADANDVKFDITVTGTQVKPVSL